MLKPLIIYADRLEDWAGLTESIDPLDDITYYTATDIEELHALAKKHNNAILLFMTKKLIDLTEVGWFWGAFGHRVETIVISKSKIDEDVKQRARFFGVMRLIEGVPEWEKFAEELTQTCFSSNWFTAPLMRMPVAKALKMLRSRRKTSMLQVKYSMDEDMPVSNDGKILPDPDTGVKMPAGLGRIYILKGIPFFAETSKEKGIDALEIITSLKSGFICISEWFISPNTVNLTDAMQEDVEEIIEFKAQLYESTESRKIELEKFASQQSILDKIRLPKEFLDDDNDVKYAQPVSDTTVSPGFEAIPDYSQFSVDSIPNTKKSRDTQPVEVQTGNHQLHDTTSIPTLKDAVEEQKKYGHHKMSEKKDKVSKAPKLSQASGLTEVHRKLLEEGLKPQQKDPSEEDTKVKISELFTDFKDALNQINVSNVKVDNDSEEESDYSDISSRPTRKLSLNNPDYNSSKVAIKDVLQESSRVSLDNILEKFSDNDTVLGASIVGPTGAIWVSNFKDEVNEVNVGLVASNFVQSSIGVIKGLMGFDSLSSMKSSEYVNYIMFESEDNSVLFKMTQVRGSFIMVASKNSEQVKQVDNLINETLLEIEHIII